MLRATLESRDETVQEFDRAADQRYWEGWELLLSGQRGAAIYLMGYSAEMLLKMACAKLEGAQPSDLVQATLGPARYWFAHAGTTPSYESGHSLLYWAALLRGRRSFHAFPPLASDADLLRRIEVLYGVWWYGARYRIDVSSESDVYAALEQLDWLRHHKIELWS